MNKAFRIICPVCILLVLSLFIACSSDNPASTRKPPEEPVLAGSIGVYADEEGTDPNLVDTGGTVVFYVVHDVANGATASAFKIETPAGWVRIGAEVQFPLSIGDIDDGIAIAYGTCLFDAVHVMTLTYQSPGNSPSGTLFKVLPHSVWPEGIQVVDCRNNLLENGIGKESPVSLP
ncbi:MAG: hypothetical protein GTO29_03930 [Candidatus Latescibacteria bacterium]|nr:hypothetical protein [Candidatus Latescibacterota bacterium]NIO55225.1 hypothetical protein [Candidatus Latescibacterota bacterium]